MLSKGKGTLYTVVWTLSETRVHSVSDSLSDDEYALCFKAYFSDIW